MGIEHMNSVGPTQELSNWTRLDMEGTTGDASVINQVRGRNQGRFISVFKYHFLLINL
jgi:hypothetical protein